MAKQFLDSVGLAQVWNKIKSSFLSLDGGTLNTGASIIIRSASKALQIDADGITPDTLGSDREFWNTVGGQTALSDCFKTINGQSIVGDGNIVIEASGGTTSDGNNYPTSVSMSYSSGTLSTTVARSGLSSISGSTTISWSNLYGKPTWADSTTSPVTLTTSGSGNVITDISMSGNTITATKGTITSGEGADGNNYVTGVNCYYLAGVLGVQIEREGLSSIVGSVILNWETLSGKPDWADNTSSPISLTTSGSGNAVTDVTLSGNTVTVTKGTISAGSSGMDQSTADGRYVLKSGDTMTGALTISSGNASTNSISAAGRITANCFYESSDERLKKDIQKIDEADVEKINSVDLKEFVFVGDDVKKYGVIAQDVEKAGLENLVSTKDDGFKSVDYISLLILKIEALEKRIKELENK